ncbi:MAG: heme exporter protein CcmD [Alphaproteobacteria bacterium]|nr:heme exporter protein CcmD [Alphaproteobacteria bacterium]
MGEFLAMGGYAAFVWPAFGVTVLVMVGLLLASLRSLRRERRALELMEKARPRRRGGGGGGAPQASVEA